jgi:hypothetical protein
MRLSHTNRGELSFGTIDIPATQLSRFSEGFLNRLNAIPHFHGAFFGHELRGTKSAYPHDPANINEREDALEDVKRYLRDDIDEDEWLIDVGLELRQEHRVLQWLRTGHTALLQHALPSASFRRIEKLADAKYFHEDTVAQLRDLAGFRVAPRTTGNADQVVYINVYPTDKAATYQLHEGLFRRRKSADVLPKNIKKTLSDIDDISKTFLTCADKMQEGNVRFEIRVPLARANLVHFTLPQELINQSVVSFPVQTWWCVELLSLFVIRFTQCFCRYFKTYRLAALHNVIEGLMNAPAAARSMPPSLMLGSICIYMLNALIYRPAEGKAYENLLECSCQHATVVNDDYEDIPEDLGDARPVMYDRGLYFVSDVIFDVAPRLPATRIMDHNLLASLYGFPFETFQEVFHVAGAREPAKANSSRMSNRRKTTTDVEHVCDDGDRNSWHTFHLADRGIALQPTMAMKGPDVDFMDVDDESDVDEEQRDNTLDALLQRCWRQFPYDVFQVSPNKVKRSEGRYVILSRSDLDNVSHDVFKSLDLSAVFDHVQARYCDAGFWGDTIFSRYFPPPEYVQPSGLQNFRQTKYYNTWNSIMARLSKTDAHRVRKELLKEFNKLMWLPFPGSDRMWQTRRMNMGQWTNVPETSCKGPSPQIIINSKVARKCPILVREQTAEQGYDSGNDDGDMDSGGE